MNDRLIFKDVALRTMIFVRVSLKHVKH